MQCLAFEKSPVAKVVLAHLTPSTLGGIYANIHIILKRAHKYSHHQAEACTCYCDHAYFEHHGLPMHF